MPRKRPQVQPRKKSASANARVSASVDELALAAQARGDESLETGRYIVTFKEGAAEEGLRSLGAKSRRLRVADARDFDDQAATLEAVGDADALVFPEIGVAVLGGDSVSELGMNAGAEIAADSPVEAIEPEYFAFANAAPILTRIDQAEYLRGFARAAQAIAHDLGVTDEDDREAEFGEDALALGATWGLVRCKVPPSLRSGAGTRVAVLDNGMDLGHPDFAGRTIVGQTFVGQPVQTTSIHGTHLIGTACGPKSPPGTIPRYGIGYRTGIFVGKVLSNSGAGTTASILAGYNWAIANKCVAILGGFGSASPVQAAYTAAGQAALTRGCVIIASAGSGGAAVGAPANSPTIMSVSSLEPNLTPSVFSNVGKIDIAAPGRDIFSSVPRPQKYATISGTSPAAAHVAGCAALWAETSPALRGIALWRKLLTTAKLLPFPPARVGAGLVQAP